MVTLTRLNGKPIMVNALLIETIEETPDTMITLVTGKKNNGARTGAGSCRMVQRFLQTVGLIGGTIKSLNSEGS